MVHSAPQIALNLDVTLSSVQFYPRHILFVMLTAFVYLGYYIFLYFMLGPSAPPIYPTNDFFNNEILASLITLSLFIYLPLQFFQMVWCSRCKLRRRYKYMKLANIKKFWNYGWIIHLVPWRCQSVPLFHTNQWSESSPHPRQQPKVTI